MKRKVTITFEIDPVEYYEANDTPEGVIEIAEDIVSGLADFPENGEVYFECGDINKTIKINEVYE